MAETNKPGDPRFFMRTGPHSLAAIAALLGCEAVDGGRYFSGCAPLQSAGPEDVSFLDNKRYLPHLAETKAGAVILHPDFAGRAPEGCVALATASLMWVGRGC